MKLLPKGGIEQPENCPGGADVTENFNNHQSTVNPALRRKKGRDFYQAKVVIWLDRFHISEAQSRKEKDRWSRLLCGAS